MRNHKERIDLGDTGTTAIMKLAEGNPGALRVCCEMAKRAEAIDPDSLIGSVTYLLGLDSLGIYGSRIWMLYKDVCGEDVVKAMGLLRACQMGIVSSVDLDSAIDGDAPIDVDAILGQLSARLPRWGGPLAAQAT